jgi:hypothetical protein
MTNTKAIFFTANMKFINLLVNTLCVEC